MAQKPNQLDSKKRFSDRVEDYVKYRPSYPKDLVLFLQQEGILTKTSIVADIGSGTGILTKLLLENGNKVYGIEPNSEMRKAGEEYLKSYKNFISIDGSSEKTTLPNNSIDVITAGQAYHWFDVSLTRIEFSRILKQSKKDNIILVWNTRTDTSPFNQELELFIKKFSNDYEKVSQTQDPKKKESLFFEKRFKEKIFENYQELDFNGLRGRLLSASYMLKKSDPKYQTFEKELMVLFQKHQNNGKVTLEYKTELFHGTI